MNSTTRKRGAQVGPTFRELMEAAGLTPAKIEAEYRVSVATVYRALNGKRPQPLYLAALATAVGCTENETRAAIERSAEAHARKAAS